MFRRLRSILEMIRFSHTLFALPFALLAAVMAWRQTAIDLGDEHVLVWQWNQFVGILLCMVFARSSAMSFNRVVDCQLDAANPRTAGRHIPAGVLSVEVVGLFSIVCSVGFIASTLFFMPNRLPFYLSLPVMLFLFGYSFAKRFTALAHFWLGAALAMTPIAAWIAVRGSQVSASPADLAPAVVLGGAILLWVAGFDIVYACQDAEFDRRVGLSSVPARWGVAGALRIAWACHMLMLGLLCLLPLVYAPFGWIYWAGVIAVALLLLYEHALVEPNDLTRVNQAFFHVNVVVSLGLLTVGAVDLLT
jgi:4-hydroxybenzoate polyprenyltransferase